MPTDQEIIARCLRGDEEAWNEMNHRIRPKVVHLAPWLDSDLYEDLVQEVQLRLSANDCRALRQFRGKSRLDTFLFTISRRVVADHFRSTYQELNRMSLEEWFEHNDPLDPSGATDTELRLAIEQTLSSTEMFILRLKVAKCPIAEIALLLSYFLNKPITKEAVRSRLTEIRKKLKREIPF